MKKCNHPKYSIVAGIFINRKLIAFGCNDIDKTHPIMNQYCEHKKLHAELSAINRCKHKHDLSKATMIIYGENKSGRCLAKPCKYCEQIIKSFNIKKVIYSTKESFDEFYL